MCKDIEIYLSQSFSLFYFYTGISAFPRWSFFTYTLLYYVSTAANIAFYTHPIMSYFMKNSTWTTNWIISVIYGLGILKGTHFNGIIFWLASMSYVLCWCNLVLSILSSKISTISLRKNIDRSWYTMIAAGPCNVWIAAFIDRNTDEIFRWKAVRSILLWLIFL